MAKAKKAAKKVVRTIMSEKQAEQFLSGWAKRHDLKGAALEKKIRLVAATRLAALERYTKKAA